MSPLSHPLFDLTDRVAVVAGGTSGIGHAIALGLAAAGAHVVATGRRAELVDRTAAEIEALGRRSLRATSDVTGPATLERLRDACVKEFGGFDIVVAAAGITKRVASTAMTDDDWGRIVATNLTGTFNTCRALGEVMLSRGRGRVITIASLASHLGFLEVAAYGATKAGVAGLTRALAVEWAPRGVTVNAIVPGVFRTDMNSKLIDSPRGAEMLTRTPMHRFGRVEELVGAAVFLASDASAFVTGQLLAVDGGYLASGVNQ
jgi:NAD(P)-dependent dehydrogenase (short-subunit alcohol dehydrogenase family)